MSGFIICNNCNAKMPAGAKFCTKCGAQLNDAAVWSSEEAKDKDTTAETSTGSLNEAPAASGKTSPGSKKKLFIGIGIAAAAAAVVIALALGLSKGNKPAESGSGTAVANSNTMSANASGSSEVKKDGPKYSGITPQTFDLFAEKTLPNAKAEGMKWDNTLFYWLEDVYTDKDDDGNIASCKIMTTMLKDTGTGDIYRYVVYKDKSNGKIYKIVSMRDTAQGMEVIDYYYKEGVPDFMFVRTESVYTPTYATTDKIGKRYYFNNNVLVRERTVDVPQQIQEKALTREETWYDRVCYFDLPDAEKAVYDATEKKVLNMAINTYNAILNSKAIGQVYGSVKNTAGQPVSDTDIRIKQASGNEWLYQAATGSDGTFSFYVYLEDVDCVMDFIPSDTAYKKSVVGSLSLTQSTLLYNVDVILHKAAGDKYAVTLNVIDAEKSLTDENGSYNEKAAGGVEVIFREGYNVRTGASAAEGKSDAAGDVKVDLPPGTYTVEIKGAGFITTYVIIEVEDKAVSEKAYLVSTPASGTTTVLLTWDDSARDLDLIAFTTEQAEGGDMARIGGGRMKDDMGNILLSDNKRGCEVIHLSTAKDGAYRIYVNDFTDSNNGTFSSDSLSRMNLKVYIFCNGNVYVYTFPAGRNGVVWEVAQVNGNTVTSVQQVSSSIEQGSMWTKKWKDDYKVGDTVILGSYEQDNNLSNGAEPIEWQVIGTRDGHTLLLSKYALDCKPYHFEEVGITWENCTLRSWLNNDFYNKAFSASDRKKIVTAHNENPDSYELYKPLSSRNKYGAEGGNATDDKVFLLSWTEARDYLDGKSSMDDDLGTESYNQKLLCRPTAYAKAQGVKTLDNYPLSDMIGCCEWWLRSPGHYQYCATLVECRGFLRVSSVSHSTEGVRPAILID